MMAKRSRLISPPQDETKLTLALYKRDTLRLRIRGEATVDSRGKFKKVVAKKVAIEEPPDPTAHSESMFERMAEQEPERLIEMIESGTVRPTMLTYAAEIAGRVIAAERVIPVLLRLLHHDVNVVREGAIYGLLRHHQSNQDARKAIEAMAASDPSAGVRAAATRTLAAQESDEEESDDPVDNAHDHDDKSPAQNGDPSTARSDGGNQ